MPITATPIIFDDVAIMIRRDMPHYCRPPLIRAVRCAAIFACHFRRAMPLTLTQLPLTDYRRHAPWRGPRLRRCRATMIGACSITLRSHASRQSRHYYCRHLRHLHVDHYADYFRHANMLIFISFH